MASLQPLLPTWGPVQMIAKTLPLPSPQTPLSLGPPSHQDRPLGLLVVNGPYRSQAGEPGPTLHSGYFQAVPDPQLAGARVQPDKDGLLFYIKKSIIPSDVPVIGREVHRHQLAGRTGVRPGICPLCLSPTWLAGAADPQWTPGPAIPLLAHCLFVGSQLETTPVWRRSERLGPSPGLGEEVAGMGPLNAW